MNTNRTPLHTLRVAALALTGSLVLSACAPALIGGAMLGGALVASDRRSPGTQVEDQSIELKAGARIRELSGDRAHVNVTSYNRLVLLTGETPEAADRVAVEQAVSAVLADGLRCIDIALPGEAVLGTEAMADAVLAKLG